MIALKVRQLRLKNDVERANKDSILKLRRDLKYQIAKILNMAPENNLVFQIYTAIQKGVQILKTNDINMLKFANIIEKNFKLRIVNEIKRSSS
ncbi:MAG: hypothetical protein Q7R33_02040 [Nitrosarchaeum sp.]|nr:hypothetical protein [Nitrosarchaeum sp.]